MTSLLINLHSSKSVIVDNFPFGPLPRNDDPPFIGRSALTLLAEMVLINVPTSALFPPKAFSYLEEGGGVAGRRGPPGYNVCFGTLK